jgi:AcrR family transcriptional regulator
MVEVLLASAAEILEAEGPEALSVRRIAAAAGVAPMGVYNHFESKNGIIEALFIQGFERLREALTTIADIADPYEALREAGRRYRMLAQAHPMVYQLMFLRTLPGYEPSDAALEVAGRAFDSLVAAVERAMAADVIAEGPLTETAQLIWASIHGWVSLELLGIGIVEDEDSGFDRVCSTMLRGLSPGANEDRGGPGSSDEPPTDTSGSPPPPAPGSSRTG